jgi:hypothetical protein
LKAVVFVFFEPARELVYDSALDYKDFVNPMGWVSWNCCSTWCRGYMYQFLDDQDMWSLVEKNPKETGALEKHNTKVSLWEFFKNSKNHVFLNPSDEHIVGYMIHLNKNKTKWKSKTRKNWSKLNGISTIYALQFVKSFTIYYIKCVCLRIWVSKVYVQELRWESIKKVSTKKT